MMFAGVCGCLFFVFFLLLVSFMFVSPSPFFLCVWRVVGCRGVLLVACCLMIAIGVVTYEVWVVCCCVSLCCVGCCLLVGVCVC